MTEQEIIKVFNTVLLLGKCELPADEANEAIKISIKDLEEIQQYREIGTVEECRDAIEKQIPKKIVRIKLRKSEYGSPFRCPVCESDLIPTEFLNEDGTESDEKISWCSGCGQKLDWN